MLTLSFLPCTTFPYKMTCYMPHMEISGCAGACLIQMPRSNDPDICWESSTAGCEQSRRLLEGVEDLVQVLDIPTREALLDLVFISADEFISRVKTLMSSTQIL